MGHASHYYKAGNSLYKDLVEAEINAWQVTGGIQSGDPHGDPTVANAGLIALYESWAEHIGLTYTDRTYSSDQQTSIAGTYLFRLESTWNKEQNHIPIGLYHDMIDNGTEPISWNADWSTSTIVTDNVSGFTNLQMFNCLTSSTNSITDFQTQLINTQLSNTSNTLNNVNSLFSSY